MLENLNLIYKDDGVANLNPYQRNVSFETSDNITLDPIAFPADVPSEGELSDHFKGLRSDRLSLGIRPQADPDRHAILREEGGRHQAQPESGSPQDKQFGHADLQLVSTDNTH